MPNSTPLVEVAQDGQTAQGVWYTIAQETVGAAPAAIVRACGGAKKSPQTLSGRASSGKIWHLVSVQ